MPRSIILLGANQSGKSTLGAQLSTELGMPYVHAGTSPGNYKKSFKACINQYNLLVDGVVLDRATPFCRRVYEKDLSQAEWSGLDIFADIMRDKAVVVYCSNAGNKPLNKDYYPEGHYDEIINAQVSIRQKYLAILFSTPYLDYNWEEESFTSILKRIRNEIV